MRYNYKRRPTRVVSVGGVGVGGDNPVRLQSMTNTPSLDVDATAAQAIRIADAGGEIVRVTTQGVREAEALGQVRELLEKQGRHVPLVADVHFNPRAAMTAAVTAHKVRINPGNFADQPRVVDDGRELSTKEYIAALDRVEAEFVPLLDLCRQHGTALRLGVNHGSLSHRVMMRYGDTPLGMTESVMEYLDIARRHDFHDIVISVKASNPVVMTDTVRMLAVRMEAEGMDYPLHLGVTEAGAGEDGRIKSAVGIGALLAEGLGDTIRVSLSEAPEREIPVAAMLRDHIARREGHDPILVVDEQIAGVARELADTLPEQERASVPLVAWHDFNPEAMRAVNAASDPSLIADDKPVALFSRHVNPVGEMASYIDRLRLLGRRNPVVLHLSYTGLDAETTGILAGADLGALLLGGYGAGIWLDSEGVDRQKLTDISLAILQAARLRFTRTEYIACPGCGRTLFDLESTLRRVQQATEGMKGLKIAVMGCIVNGPGEMADADYGYVGAGPGRVTLYRGKTPVVKNIPQEEAVDCLLQLLEADGIV